MKVLIAILTSLSLLISASNVVAGGHKNKADKSATTVTDADNGQGKNSSRNRSGKDSDEDDHTDDDNHDGDDSKNKSGKGNEQSQEMRSRSEERKQIKEEYKSDRKPGQESNKGEDGKPEKKPWYKFWE